MVRPSGTTGLTLNFLKAQLMALEALALRRVKVRPLGCGGSDAEAQDCQICLILILSRPRKCPTCLVAAFCWPRKVKFVWSLHFVSPWNVNFARSPHFVGPGNVKFVWTPSLSHHHNRLENMVDKSSVNQIQAKRLNYRSGKSSDRAIPTDSN